MLGRSIVSYSRSSALRGVRRGAHHAPQGTSFEPSAIAARLALNPTAETVGKARARPVIETKAQRKHWKRNGDPLVKPGGLLGNFADAKHTACGRRKSPPRGVSREAFAGAVDGGATRTMLGRRSVVAVGEAVLIISCRGELRGLRCRAMKSSNYFLEV